MLSDHVTDVQSSSARKGSKGDPSITRTGPRTFSHPRQSTEHNAYFYSGVLLIGSVILAAVFIIAIYLPRSGVCILGNCYITSVYYCCAVSLQ